MEDTRAAVRLFALAAFSDAIIGPRMRANAKDPAAARDGFVDRLGDMTTAYLKAKA